MISVIKIGGQVASNTTEIVGLSSDIKPITNDIPNGSTFYTIDTKETFMFDGENLAWYEM